VGVLFAALPPDSNEEPPGVLGEWDCKSEDTSVELTAQGDQLTARIPGLPLGKGTLRDGIAHIVITNEEDSFEATAAVKSEKLFVTTVGTQRPEGELPEPREFTCERAVPPERWRSSTALVPLYYSDGVYSTTPRAGAQAVARVWRNPARILLLDGDAKPVRNH
jgi:hypothetical protein